MFLYSLKFAIGQLEMTTNTTVTQSWSQTDASAPSRHLGSPDAFLFTDYSLIIVIIISTV